MWYVKPLRLFPGTASALMLLAAWVVAGKSVQQTVESGAERVARTGVMWIRYMWELPYAFQNVQGQVTGESPAVARAVLEQMGIQRMEWVQTPFRALISDLRTGRFDLIAAGLFITPERAGLVAFTGPSVCIEPALLVKQGNPLGLHSLEDIASQAGARLAVIAGAVEGLSAAQAGIPPKRIIAFPHADLAVGGIRQGLVDALALSDPTIQHIADAQPSMERVRPYLQSGKNVRLRRFHLPPTR